VCRVAVESGGFSIAWFGTVDPATLTVVPVARAGAAADYLDIAQHACFAGRRGADTRVCSAETHLGAPGYLAMCRKRVETSLDPAGTSACATSVADKLQPGRDLTLTYCTSALNSSL